MTNRVKISEDERRLLNTLPDTKYIRKRRHPPVVVQQNLQQTPQQNSKEKWKGTSTVCIFLFSIFIVIPFIISIFISYITSLLVTKCEFYEIFTIVIFGVYTIIIFMYSVEWWLNQIKIYRNSGSYLGDEFFRIRSNGENFI